jgi:hypothetical protein
MITQHELDAYLGKSIGAICQNGYASGHDNHGAHFVSHVLAYKFGLTCQMMGNGTGPAATLRVQDLFPRCKAVGVWSLRPASLSTCLVFITRASNLNLAAKTIATAPRTQVGIFVGGFVWHYSGTRHQVVRESRSQFARYYPSPDNAMFYGSLP